MNFQILAVTETWLSSSIYDNEILLSQYTIYRNDHKSRGGGIMIAISQTIPSKIISRSKELEVATYYTVTLKAIN